MYGSWVMFCLYGVCGIAASATSFAFGPGGWSVGASGAIFGMFGVIVMATRFHHAILDNQSRALAGQIVFLIVINLAIGFSGIFNVDNFAHVGGLIAGLWLGFVLPPTQVQTLAAAWQGSRGERSAAQTKALRLAAVVALVVVIAGVTAYGTSKWQATQDYKDQFPQGAVPARVIAAAAFTGPAIEPANRD
jgi:hypothetical protein